MTHIEVVTKMQDYNMIPIGLTSIFEPKEEQKLKLIELKMKPSTSSKLGISSMMST